MSDRKEESNENNKENKEYDSFKKSLDYSSSGYNDSIIGDVNYGPIVKGFINIPWKFTEKEYNKFVTLNNKVDIDPYDPFIQKVRIPVNTDVDFSPLFPFCKWYPFKSIVKVNNKEHTLEIQDNSVLSIRDMGPFHSQQCAMSLYQMARWILETKQTGIFLDSTTEYTISLSTPPINQFHRYCWLPDISYMSLPRYQKIPNASKKMGTFKNSPPEFIMLFRDYGLGSNNDIEYLRNRMCKWMRSGVESGILFDGKDNQIYLYARLNISALNNDPPQQIQSNHDQIQSFHTDMILKTQQIDESLSEKNTHLLQESIQLSQKKLEKLDPIIQIYYQNLVPDQHYQDICYLSIPFENPDHHSQPSPTSTQKNGPNLIINCIGAVNGLKFDLSQFEIN